MLWETRSFDIEGQKPNLPPVQCGGIGCRAAKRALRTWGMIAGQVAPGDSVCILPAAEGKPSFVTESERHCPPFGVYVCLEFHLLHSAAPPSHRIGIVLGPCRNGSLQSPSCWLSPLSHHQPPETTLFLLPATDSSDCCLMLLPPSPIVFHVLSCMTFLLLVGRCVCWRLEGMGAWSSGDLGGGSGYTECMWSFMANHMCFWIFELPHFFSSFFSQGWGAGESV